MCLPSCDDPSGDDTFCEAAWLQEALLPASLIGGLLGLVLISTGLSLGYTGQDYVAFAFLFFTLSFLSLVLTGLIETPAEQSVQPSSVKTAPGVCLSAGPRVS